MKVQAFFDDGRTFTLTYVIYDETSKDAIILDPVLDLDTTPWRTFTESIEKVAQFVAQNALNVHWVLDTHVHADHLSGAHELKARFHTACNEVLWFYSACKVDPLKHLPD